MKFLVALVLPALAAAQFGWGGSVCPKFELKYQNLMNAQPMSPMVVIAHNPDFHLYTLGQASLPQLGTLSQTGDYAPLVAALESAGVKPNVCGYTVLTGTGPGNSVGPLGGMSGTFTMEPNNNQALCDCSTMVFSLASMAGSTNDGFVGLRDAKVDQVSESVIGLEVYDTGTEQNTDACNDIPGPLSYCNSNGQVNNNPSANNNPQPGEGVVLPHRGHSNTNYDWSDELAANLHVKPIATGNNNAFLWWSFLHY